MKTKTTKLFILFLAIQLVTIQFGFSQEKLISGLVKDESGLPASGVNILIKGTSIGAQTDFDGI